MVETVKGKIGRAKELCEERLMRGGLGQEHVRALMRVLDGRVWRGVDEACVLWDGV